MWQVALIVLCHSVSNKHHKSVTNFILPSNISENGGQKKRQRPCQLPFSRSSSLLRRLHIALTQARRSALIWLYCSRFRMQRASWRYQILAKLLAKFRQKRRPECVTIASGLVQPICCAQRQSSFGRDPRGVPFNLRTMVTVSCTRNFWIEYLSCNGDLISKIKDQTEFCTLAHNVEAPDTSRKWLECKTASATSQNTFYC